MKRQYRGRSRGIGTAYRPLPTDSGGDSQRFGQIGHATARAFVGAACRCRSRARWIYQAALGVEIEENGAGKADPLPARGDALVRPAVRAGDDQFTDGDAGDRRVPCRPRSRDREERPRTSRKASTMPTSPVMRMLAGTSSKAGLFAAEDVGRSSRNGGRSGQGEQLLDLPLLTFDFGHGGAREERVSPSRD